MPRRATGHWTFLDLLEEQEYEEGPGVGVGMDRRFESAEMSGFELVYNTHQIHLAAFAKKGAAKGAKHAVNLARGLTFAEAAPGEVVDFFRSRRLQEFRVAPQNLHVANDGSQTDSPNVQGWRVGISGKGGFLAETPEVVRVSGTPYGSAEHRYGEFDPERSSPQHQERRRHAEGGKWRGAVAHEREVQRHFGSGCS